MLKKIILSTTTVAILVTVVLIVVIALLSHNSLSAIILTGICSLWILLAFIVNRAYERRMLELFKATAESRVEASEITTNPTPLSDDQYSQTVNELTPKPLNSKKHDR